ncbi:HD domain-containing protein [Streptomyces catenulae]|uniref:HD domain-containing protein n=1 Tax=Streptomyces catenulae TaxID=66875 RepID=A0ABV2YW62_9ACTN
MAIRGAAGALALWALVHTLRSGIAQPGVALAFGTLIAVGELARQRPAGAPGEHDRAPLAAAGALAYALLGEVAGVPAPHGPAQTVVVVGVAGLVGTVSGPGRGPAADRLARHLLTCGCAALCVQPLYAAGPLASWAGRGHVPLLVLLGLLALTALGDAALTAAFDRARTGRPYGTLLRREVRASGGIGAAVGATGVVTALATAVAGLWALPVFALPLLLTQCALRRFAAVRATRRQTIASLARATEIAGYTPPGHARRVAALSRAVGGELGLREPELDLLEYAALMHDIGQLSLVDPVPSGATAPLPPAEQRRIARLGGAVVRQTGVPAEVAVIVERQADPYREQPVTARIVRTVNAYDDWAGRAGVPGGAPWVLERLAGGREFAPEVVAALARVLARGGRTG